MRIESRPAILLPGIVLPAELAYPGLIEALGEEDGEASSRERVKLEEPSFDEVDRARSILSTSNVQTGGRQ
jgi:hypothetical protein